MVNCALSTAGMVADSRAEPTSAAGTGLAFPAHGLVEAPAPVHPLRLARASAAAANSDLPAPTRATYLRLLTWAFTFFNSVRLLAYMPTIWTLAQSGDSSQHSLWTWGTWFCANVTMSLWLMERNGSRLDRAAAVNIGNAVMCLAVIGLIVAARV